MKKISIVVPAYNAEKTIGMVIDSIATALSLVRETTEIIVVNDGSKDDTLNRLEALAKSFPRSAVEFRVVNQENGGCYRARLSGLKVAQGEFIGFVDSDDYVEPEMYVEMLRVAAEEHVDVVECGWRFEGMSEPDARPCSVIGMLKERDAVLAGYILPTLVGCGDSAYLWNKIYRNQYDFSTWIDGDFGSYEDLIHNLQLFTKVNSYARTDKRFYRYAPSNASVTRTFNSMHIKRLNNTAKAKRELIAPFVSSDMVGGCMRSWIANERKNYVKKAILAAHGNPLKMAANLLQILKVEG